ncbi:aldehyde dehydrogenase family protein, partial [Achromobacter xylosoxidans]
MAGKTHKTASGDVQLPANNGVYYDGGWHAPVNERWTDITAPGTGERLMAVADAGAEDVARAARAARAGARAWRRTAPL